MLRCLKVFILAALVAALTAGPVQAAGQLDQGFGQGGRLGVAPIAGGFKGGDAALAPDGSIYLASDRYVARVLPGGRFDPSFGTNGGFALIEPPEHFSFSLTDIAVDESGRPLVFGSVIGPDPEPDNLYGGPATTSALVQRFQPDGTLDRSFSSDGTLMAGFGLNRFFPTYFNFTRGWLPSALLTAASLDAQGRILLAISEPIYQRGNFPRAARLVVRLDESGAIDPSFGEDGVTALAGDMAVADMAIDRGGKITIAGGPIYAEFEGPLPGDPDLVLTRLLPDGRPDRSFGRFARRGYRGGGNPLELAINRDGDLSVLAGNYERKTVRLLKADGGPVRGFGRGGIRGLTGERDGHALEQSDLLLDARRRVLVLGVLEAESRAKGRQTIERLLPSGRLDRGFGHGGTVLTGFGAASYYEPLAALFSGVRLITVGIGNWGNQSSGVLLARYRLGG